MERHIGKIMVDERLTEGSIYDINVVYNSKLVGYTTSMSHMNELYAIGFGTLKITLKFHLVSF